MLVWMMAGLFLHDNDEGLLVRWAAAAVEIGLVVVLLDAIKKRDDCREKVWSKLVALVEAGILVLASP